MGTKRFDIETQVVRVCEGGRSTCVPAVDKGCRTTTFLRNWRFMYYNRKYQLDQYAAMAAVEGTVPGGRCLPWKRLSKRAAKYTASAAKRAGSAVAGILKGTLARLTQVSVSSQKRKRVSWAPRNGL